MNITRFPILPSRVLEVGITLPTGKGEKYLGLGPSAHSYNGIERRWNVAK